MTEVTSEVTGDGERKLKRHNLMKSDLRFWTDVVRVEPMHYVEASLTEGDAAFSFYGGACGAGDDGAVVATDLTVENLHAYVIHPDSLVDDVVTIHAVCPGLWSALVTCDKGGPVARKAVHLDGLE